MEKQNDQVNNQTSTDGAKTIEEIEERIRLLTYGTVEQLTLTKGRTIGASADFVRTIMRIKKKKYYHNIPQKDSQDITEVTTQESIGEIALFGISRDCMRKIIAKEKMKKLGSVLATAGIILLNIYYLCATLTVIIAKENAPAIFKEFIGEPSILLFILLIPMLAVMIFAFITFWGEFRQLMTADDTFIAQNAGKAICAWLQTKKSTLNDFMAREISDDMYSLEISDYYLPATVDELKKRYPLKTDLGDKLMSHWFDKASPMRLHAIEAAKAEEAKTAQGGA